MDDDTTDQGPQQRSVRLAMVEALTTGTGALLVRALEAGGFEVEDVSHEFRLGPDPEQLPELCAAPQTVQALGYGPARKGRGGKLKRW